MLPLEWHTEKRQISVLIPSDNNPRQMTEAQLAVLRASIEKFNLVEIPAINLNNKILSGHQRIKILQIIGRGNEDIDVRIPSRLLDENEEKEYLIRANKNTGEWNFDMLINFGPDILKLSGFSDDELGLLKISSGAELDIQSHDRPPKQQMRFTLTAGQIDIVKSAIQKAKDLGHDNPENDHGNSNALEFICKRFIANG